MGIKETDLLRQNPGMDDRQSSGPFFILRAGSHCGGKADRPYYHNRGGMIFRTEGIYRAETIDIKKSKHFLLYIMYIFWRFYRRFMCEICDYTQT